MSYNVFISFKKQVDGQKTRDCVIAETLYNELSKYSEIKPFFSEKELKDNANFGETIDKALESAVFFIYICTDASYLNTPYVKSEWETFSNEIKSGRKPDKLFGLLSPDVKIGDLPLALRRYSFYTLDNIDALVAIIRDFFAPDAKIQSIEQFNKKNIDLLNSDTETAYSRPGLNDFIDLAIAENKRLSVVRFKNNCGYRESLYSKLCDLYDNGEKFVYFNAVEEVSPFLDSFDFSSVSEQYIFICRKILNAEQLALVFGILEQFSNVCFAVGIENENIDLFNAVEDDVQCFVFDTLSETEVQEYIEQLAKENETVIGSNLRSIILLPALVDFRTPQMLKNIITHIKRSYTEYQDWEFNVTDIFDILDSYIDGLNISDDVDGLIFTGMKKGVNYFLSSDFPNTACKDILLRDGIMRKKGNAFVFSSREYFNNRVAETLFNTFGLRYTDESFSMLKECIPYYIYIYFQNTGKLIIDDFDLNADDKNKLLQLFVSEDDVFENILLSRNYDAELILLLQHFRRCGLYAIAKKIITLYEMNKIPPSEDLDYLSEKILINYYETGTILETDETFGTILYRKAYINYCIDNLQASRELFEQAFAKMLTDGFNPRLVFDYIIMLLDIGAYEKISELMTMIENADIVKDDSFYMEYYYIKAVIYLDNLEFALCVECLNKCIKLCEKNVNIKKLQIYYGAMGEALIYSGSFIAAKKYIQINLDIAKAIGDFNGMAISAKMLGKCELCLQNFRKAYNCISYAETYAQKANNFWRLAKSRLLLAVLLKDITKVEEVGALIENIDSRVYDADAYLVYSYYYFVRGDNAKAVECSEKALKSASMIDNKRLEETNKAWNMFLNGQLKYEADSFVCDNDDSTDAGLKPYIFAVISALVNLKDNDFDLHEYMDFYLYEEMESERLLLRIMNITDLADIYEYSSDSFCTKYVFWNRHKSYIDTANFLSNVYDESNLGKYMCWAIQDKQSSKVIGTIDLLYNTTYNEVEVGYIINKNYQRHGYGKEALERVIDFCRDVLRLKKIIGVAFEVNEASRKLLESCGFSLKEIIENYHNKPLIANKRGVLYEYDFSCNANK